MYGYTVKVGNYEGHVADIMKKYSPDFMHIPEGRLDVFKVGMFQRENGMSYQIVASQSLLFKADYNLMVTVLGPQQGLVDKIVGDVESAIGIKMRDAPQFLNDHFAGLARIAEMMMQFS